MNAHAALSIESITQDDARHVLFFRGGEHGYQPGSFTQKVLEAAFLADDPNLLRLSLGFKGLISAFYISKQEIGMEILTGIAQGANDNVVAAAEAILRGDN